MGKFSLYLALLALFFSSTAAVCQEQTNDLSRSVVDLKQRIENNPDSDDKTELLTQIKTAQSNLSKIDELKKRMAADQEAANTAQRRAANDRIALDRLKNTKPIPPSIDTKLPEVESKVTDLKATIKQLTADLAANEQESTRRTARRQELRPLYDDAENRLNDAQAKIRALSSEPDSLATQTGMIVQMTAKSLAETEKASFSAELARYDAADQEQTLRHRRDLLTEQLAQQQTQLTAYELRRTELRQQEAEEKTQKAQAAENEKSRQNPLLASSYAINTELAKRAEAVESRALEAKAQLDTIEKEVTRVQRSFADTKKRIETIGLTESIGALLRQRKAKLPDTTRSRADAQKIKDEMNDVQYEMFDMDQRRDELSITKIIAEIEAANGPQSDAVLESLDKPMEELIAARKERLDSLKGSLERLFEERLAEIEYKDRLLLNETEKFREYIDERILWIQSNELLFSRFEVDNVDWEIVKPASWGTAFQYTGKAISESKVFVILATLVVVILLLMSPRFRREIDRLGQIAKRGSCDSFRPTIKTFVLTLMLAIAVPLIPFWLGLLILDYPKTDSLLFNSLGPALLTVAWFMAPFEVLRQICRPGGLANEHFDWSDRCVNILRKYLRQMITIGTGFVFIIALFRSLDQAHGVDSIERTLFVLGMIGFAYFAWKTFHPQIGIFSDYLQSREQSWANKMRFLWFGLIVGMPILLAILAILGYYYTAIQFADRMFATFVFAVVFETLRELLKRAILVRRRHVHIESSRRRHEEQMQMKKAAAESDGDETPHLLEYVPNPNDIQLDIDENAKQANKLVSLGMVLAWAFGLWIIWTDVLPAINALDNYTVWPAGGVAEVDSEIDGKQSIFSNGSDSSSGESSEESNKSETKSESKPKSSGSSVQRITARDVLFFLIILLVTLFSTRSLPAAVEMLLLEQLPFDRSLRYAIRSLISYGIVIVGCILAFRALSIGWENVQWLATALTFGLAFGLQEIFANFVAGIILMFERPFRIGDWVTVDQFTGVVTKIRTRATTIVNWDRKEYIIPNRDFITGRLVNWTLSDNINRIVITIGIAYGSDVERAKQILLDICQQHPRIIDEPSTSVAFELFGDSALNITLRTFLGEVEGRLGVIDDLHTQINNAFNDAGIEIAFPQQDINIKNLGDLSAGSAKDER